LKTIFQNLEDLVSTVTLAVERLKSRGHCTPADYENVTKSLRYQLVAMAMGYMCQQSTPRIEVKVRFIAFIPA
jgi:L-arabinose isomerase